MLNKIVLMGRLTAGPELRKTPSGKSVTSFCLAVDRDYKPDGEERKADFINCVAWSSTAEFVCRNFHKGSPAAVTGTLQSRKATTKDGNERTYWDVMVEKVYFAGSNGSSGNRSDDRTVSNSQEAELEEYSGYDSNLPF